MKAMITLLHVVQLLSVAFTAAAEKVIIHEIQQAQQQFHPKDHEMESPFLSATLKTQISPVSTSINVHQLNSLSSALVAFFQRVFEEQQVYDVEVVGVAIFEETLVQNNGGRKLMMDGRKLALNALQSGQFHFQLDEEDEEESVSLDDNDESVDDENTRNEEEYKQEESSVGNGYTLTFATVVSGEHQKHQSLSHADFQTMLVHICHKFDSHMVEYVTGIDDGYFENVESVVVSGYEDASTVGLNRAEEEEEGQSNKLNPASSIVGVMVVGILVLVLLVIGSVKIYRRRHQLKKSNRWRTQEIATANNNTGSSQHIKSLRVLYSKPQDDDYSFNPLGTDNGYNGKTTFDYDNANTSFDSHGVSPLSENDSRPAYHRGEHSTSTTRGEETSISFGNRSSFPTSSLFPQSSIYDEARPNESNSIKSSSPAQQQVQHVFAPPGKVGVAIDVLDGNPIVHKVKKGSPLEGLLKPNDWVLAIDDVDTTCMSAADVTHLMVKRMNYNRKITFVRGERS